MSAAVDAFADRGYISTDQMGQVVPFRGLTSRVALARHSEKIWSMALSERFNALTSLPKGWDGYAGRPVSFTCAKFAAQILERLYDGEVPPPSLVPGSDGSLQIEWHINQYDIEIDVLAPFHLIATRFDILSGDEEEIELQADVTVLANWIRDLKTDRNAGQAVEAA